MNKIERGTEPTKGARTNGGCGSLIAVLIGVALTMTIIGAIVGLPLIWAATQKCSLSGHCPHCRKVMHAALKAEKNKLAAVESECPHCGYGVWFVEAAGKIYPSNPEEADHEQSI